MRWLSRTGPSDGCSIPAGETMSGLPTASSINPPRRPRISSVRDGIRGCFFSEARKTKPDLCPPDLGERGFPQPGYRIPVYGTMGSTSSQRPAARCLATLPRHAYPSGLDYGHLFSVPSAVSARFLGVDGEGDFHRWDSPQLLCPLS